MNNIFKEMDRFTDRNKNNKIDCKSATKQNDGTCLGYQYGDDDDEPIEQCKLCKKCSSPYEDLNDTGKCWGDKYE